MNTLHPTILGPCSECGGPVLSDGATLVHNCTPFAPLVASEAGAESELLCHFTMDAPVAAGEAFMFMPAGVQEITPSQGGKPVRVRVLVDESGARALESQRQALTAKGKKPYFDFNHEDREASFWPTEFFWRPDGIFARGEWSDMGQQAITGKRYRQFSPVFHVDDVRGNPARIVARHAAKANMGGLVNDPAFHTILPFWAKNADGAQSIQNQNPNTMTPEQLAALQAKNTELQTEIDRLKTEQAALKAKNENDALVASELKAREAELRLNQATLETEQLKAKNTALEASAKARAEQDADKAIADAVARGAIAAKDEDAKKSWKALIVADSANAALLAKVAGNPALDPTRRTTSSVVVTGESANAKLKAYGALVAQNADIRLSAETAKQKGRLAREAAAIFAKDIATDESISGMAMDEALKAADFSDAQVGLLSGTLVLQRALPLLMHEYPVLSAVTSDFSDTPGLFNQTENTRIILTPAVQTHNPLPGSDGRPLGWDTVSPAQTVDVPVTLNEHVGVPIVFGTQTLAATVRNLFQETAPQALYALGGHMVNKLTALMTAANFNAYAGTSVTGGETTDESTTITVATTANMYPGQRISGTGIPANTYVRSISSGTVAVITQAATATNTGLTFTLSGGKVPTTYATYVKALADFNTASLGDMKAAFSTNEVPTQGRFAMLNASYYARLGADPTLNSFFAATRRPEIVTEGSLPPVQGFQPIEAPWFPSSSNRVGFAGHKASLIMKTRLPSDFSTALGTMVPGSVTTVTVPGGFSVLLVQYVDLKGSYAEWRPEVMLGAAVGERRCGLVITSA